MNNSTVSGIPALLNRNWTDPPEDRGMYTILLFNKSIQQIQNVIILFIYLFVPEIVHSCKCVNSNIFTEEAVLT